MKPLKILLLTSCAFLAAEAAALDTVYVIRHAEKEAGWPEDRALGSMHPLSAEGLARSERWADALAESGIAAVYCSETTRSLHTGLATSRSLEIPISVDMRTVNADAVEEFLAEMQAKHGEDQAILIIGHSNTVPYFLQALELSEECIAELGVSEQYYGPGVEGNDGLWALQMGESGCGRAKVTRLP